MVKPIRYYYIVYFCVLYYATADLLLINDKPHQLQLQSENMNNYNAFQFNMVTIDKSKSNKRKRKRSTKPASKATIKIKNKNNFKLPNLNDILLGEGVIPSKPKRRKRNTMKIPNIHSPNLQPLITIIDDHPENVQSINDNQSHEEPNTEFHFNDLYPIADVPPPPPRQSHRMITHTLDMELLSFTNIHSVIDNGSLSEIKNIQEIDLKEFCEYYKYLQRNPPFIADIERKIYVLRDWDSRKNSISNSFHIVIIDEDDDEEPEPLCLCNQYKMWYQCKHTLAVHISNNYQSYNLDKALFKEFGPANDIWNVSDVKLITKRLFGYRNAAYYVYAAQKPQIVYVNNDGCITCRLCKQSVTCPHRHRLMEVKNITYDEYKEQRAEINIQSCSRDFDIQMPDSFKRVPPPKPHRITMEHYDDYDDYIYDSRKFQQAIFTTEIDHCEHCGDSFMENGNVNYSTIPHRSVLFALETSYPCTVINYLCHKCGNINPFDGKDEHIFNRNSKSLYTHSLLNHRTNNLHTNRASAWESWRKDICRVYEENGAPVEFPSVKTIQDVWNAFVVYVQNWKYDFICPLGCDRGGDSKGECDAVASDAIVIYLKQHRATTAVNPTTVYDATQEVKNKQSSRFSDRYITRYQLRTLSQRWYQTTFPKYHRETRLDPINQSEYNKLLLGLNKDGYKEFVKLIKWTNDNVDTISNTFLSENELFDKDFQHVIRALVSNEIVLASIPVHIIDILINDDEDISSRENRIKFKKYSPLLHSLLFVNSENIQLPPAFMNVLKHAALRAKAVLDKLIQKQKHDEIKPTQDQLDEFNNYQKSGSWYSATKKRNRPLYQQDSVDLNKLQDDDICNKNYVAFQKKTGGIFQLRCLIHGICIGFHVIPNCEGRNDPFSAVYCHFNTAPKVMMSDFNCQVHPYCMSREAEFYQHTLFPGDAMHHKSHCKCSECYNEKQFKSKGISKYSLWNGAAVEERHRVISKLKEVSAHMCMEQFMIQLRLLIEMDNRRIIRDIRGWN